MTSSRRSDHHARVTTRDTARRCWPDRSAFTARSAQRDDHARDAPAIADPARRDIAYAVVLSVLGTALMSTRPIECDGDVPGTEAAANLHFDGLLTHWVALPLFLLVTVPVAWRRAAPRLAAGRLPRWACVVNQLLVGASSLRCGVAFPVALLLVFAAADAARAARRA